MKVILQARVPTHHNSTDLRNLNLKHYKQHGSGVHESWEFFQTKAEAVAHMKGRDTNIAVNFISGFELDEFIQGKEHHNIKWD